MAANAPQHHQGNALPIMPPHFARPTPADLPTSSSSSSPSSPPSHSLASLRRNHFPSRQQQPDPLGYMLVTGGMDEDVARSLALPPLSSDPPPPLTTGQTRPLPANNQLSTTLPLRRPQSINTTPWTPQTGLPPSYYRPHQRTPSLGSASDASDSSIDSLASSNMASKADPSPAVKRKDMHGDCSICWEPFEAEKNELLWCKLTCGNNFHKKCFVEWLVTPKHQRTSSDLTCPFCRGTWDPAELRTLQIESGIAPPRPYKRPRPDFPTRRTDMRRMYRDRRTARTEFQPGMVRPGGDSYRPNYARMAPGMSQAPQAPHPINTSTANYGPPLPSMRSGHVTQPTSPQAPMPPSRYNNSVPHYPLAYPSQPMSYAPQLAMPTSYGSNNHGHFQPYTGLQAMTATPQSHDLTAQGYNVPAFSSNAFTPMTPQQPRMAAGPSQQRPISRCPAMRAQQQMSPISPPPMNTMGSPTSQYFCPGMMGPSSFEAVQINYQYNAYYHFAGGMMP